MFENVDEGCGWTENDALWLAEVGAVVVGIKERQASLIKVNPGLPLGHRYSIQSTSIIGRWRKVFGSGL